jgi:hypothetical protein
MSSAAPKPAKKSRWLDWKTNGTILADLPEGEPTKPSIPGFVGFVGSAPEELPNIRVRSQLGEESAPEPERGISWAEWKAAALNRLFREQGVTGQPGRITATTIRHGEAGLGRKSGSVSAVDCAATHEQPMSPVEPTE